MSLGKKLYEERGRKTVGLLLRITEDIQNSGRVIILDLGFCILRGIVELSKVGLFASALIKKEVLAQTYQGQRHQSAL